MKPTTRLQLEELRKEAFKRLEIDKHKATVDERRSINSSLRGAISLVSRQALSDIRVYPIWDCLAMWLDTNSGLAHYEPEVILTIAKELLND